MKDDVRRPGRGHAATTGADRARVHNFKGGLHVTRREGVMFGFFTSLVVLFGSDDEEPVVIILD